MKPVFKDNKLQQQYEEKGYVVLPLLSGPQIESLLEVFAKHIDRGEVTGLYESGRKNDYRTNKIINDSIKNALHVSFETYFKNSRLYGGTFMVKSAIDSSVLPLHQDWTVVDEDRYSTLLIWCPLVDVGEHNGGLFLVEGSHTYFHTLRSGSLPSKRYPLPPEYDTYLTHLRLKAGEAVLYSDKLFHGSHANKSKQHRVVVIGRVMEEEAPLIYCHQEKQGEVEIYETDAAFYIENADLIARGKIPEDLKPTYVKPYVHREITTEALMEKIAAGKHKTKSRTLFWRSWFK